MCTVKIVGNKIGEDHSKIKTLYAPGDKSCFLRHFLKPEEGIADYVRRSAFDLKSHYAVEANTGDVYIGEHYENTYCPVQYHHEFCSL